MKAADRESRTNPDQALNQAGKPGHLVSQPIPHRAIAQSRGYQRGPVTQFHDTYLPTYPLAH